MQAQQSSPQTPNLSPLPEIGMSLENDHQQHGHMQEYPSQNLILKKHSINTASSTFDDDSDDHQSTPKYSQSQLAFSSVQLLELQIGCKITENSPKFPSCFALINLPKKNPHVNLKELTELNFSVLSYSIQDLIDFSTEIIFSNAYAKSIFTRQQTEELVTAIATSYNKVSYHNFSHAFSLMQLNFLCIELMPQFKSHFTPEELFYTFLSALSHDLNHNGTNNMFQVKRKTDLALKYHNESVLENMHVSVLWKILKDNPSLNFLHSSKNQNHTKEIITKLILSTDMSSHFKNLEMLQKRRKQSNINLEKCEDRMFMMEQVFHSCDLGNPTLEYDSYISWAALLSHEFNEQAKLQKRYGVEATKNFEYRNLSTLYNDQVWFVGKIVHPLWKQICLHLPELNVLKKRIEENTEILNEKLTEEELKART